MKRLGKAGQEDAAAEVKKLAKPSIPVWTANQLARREPGELRALLRSAEDLRKAQEKALAGKGVADLQKRLDEQRRAVRALAKLGRHILADEGRAVSVAIVERILDSSPIRAIEVFHRYRSSTRHLRFLDLARRRQLRVSGGSDFHGDDHPKNGSVGSFTTPPAFWKELEFGLRGL